MAEGFLGIYASLQEDVLKVMANPLERAFIQAGTILMNKVSDAIEPFVVQMLNRLELDQPFMDICKRYDWYLAQGLGPKPGSLNPVDVNEAWTICIQMNIAPAQVTAIYHAHAGTVGQDDQPQMRLCPFPASAVSLDGQVIFLGKDLGRGTILLGQGWKGIRQIFPGIIHLVQELQEATDPGSYVVDPVIASLSLVPFTVWPGLESVQVLNDGHRFQLLVFHEGTELVPCNFVVMFGISSQLTLQPNINIPQIAQGHDAL